MPETSGIETVTVIAAVISMRVPRTNLLQLVVETLTTEKLVLERTGRHCVEVQVAIHVGRDEAVVRFEELADLDLGQLRLVVSEGT